MEWFRHICGETNHYFEPRYDSEMPQQWKIQGATAAGLEALKKKTYRGDVCRYCGKLINNLPPPPEGSK